MKKNYIIFVSLLLLAGFAVAGCAQKKAESGSAAIEFSKTLESTKAKADYLLAQAQSFYNSKEFQDAVSVAQHVLSSVDKDSTKAKELLEKAKTEMAEAAKKALADFKKGLTAGK